VGLRKRLVRQNGDGPSHRAEADQVFRNLGTIYDSWYDTFGRRSYDGRNSLIVAATNFDPRYGAGWDPKAKQLVLSKGFGVPLDVVAHEFAHGVVLSELPGFSHKGENGALGEAIADMFASNLDPDDWQIGEDLPIGTRRDMKDPHKHKTGRYRHAADTSEYVRTDRPFSPPSKVARPSGRTAIVSMTPANPPSRL
jgi:Zn-dependent metalloprotease